MHQRCVRCPARGAQCDVRCPVRAAQCGCPVWGAQCPVKGHYWTPGAGRKKGGWLGRGPAKPGRRAPALRKGQDGPLSIPLSASRSFCHECCFLCPTFSRRRVRGHFPEMVVYPSTHPAGRSLLWKCFPPPTSNKYWKRFLPTGTDQKTMEDKGTDGRRRHGPEDQK